MLVCGGLIKLWWSEVYSGLNRIGKVILFPMFLICTIALVLVGVVETISVDFVVFVCALFSNEISVRDVFEYFYD